MTKRQRIAIAGFGTVGQAVARLIQTVTPPDLELAWIFNRGVERKKAPWAGADVRWTDTFQDLLGPDVDIVVELAGGLSPAREWIADALGAGKSVVTANKQVISESGPELLALADDHGVSLGFEAAVAGGIPVIRGVKDGLAADRLLQIRGVLNGTCNYILTRMETTGSSFADALAEAQARGLAEADPSRDVNGDDARAKLAILSWVGLSCRVNPAHIHQSSIVPIESVDLAYARRLGCTIRQVSYVARDEADPQGVFAWVRPALVGIDSPLAQLHGSQNAVLTRGEFGGETGFYGLGAGGDPTAVAVVSDLIEISSLGRAARRTRILRATTSCRVNADFVAPQYLRFVVRDRPGILAAIAAVLARHDINLDAVLQEPCSSKSRLPFVITLERCRASALDAALAEIGTQDFHVEPPVALPILEQAKQG